MTQCSLDRLQKADIFLLHTPEKPQKRKKTIISNIHNGIAVTEQIVRPTWAVRQKSMNHPEFHQSR